jgi:hypothetical protein
MKLFGRELVGFPKALAVLVAVLLVASGLCGLSQTIEARNGWSMFGPGMPNTLFGDALSISNLVSAAAIAISISGIVLVLIGWPVSFLYRLIAKPSKDRVQRLFDDSKEEDHDEPR